MAAAIVIGDILRVGCARAFVGDFVPFIAVVYVHYVTFLSEFNAVFVGKFVKTPKLDPEAAGLPVVEAVGSSFLRNVLDIEVKLPTQCLDCLI